VKNFAANDEVQFADVVLSGGGPRGGPGANPGAGGWPTIRYYNSETGVEGKSYEKKTSMPMCDELGPKGDTLMDEYVREAAGISTCSIEPPYEGCSDKEKGYVSKMKGKSADEIHAARERLDKLKSNKMKPELVAWVDARLAIVKSIQKAAAAAGNKDEL